ncbi:MAG: CHAT domain-containing protein [Fulvivirga sp.]|uniref:CHAT domain-containing protein n=1 Tax=Marinoscillum sp. TaxID=2024838 RepID=UPI0032FAEAD7
MSDVILEFKEKVGSSDYLEVHLLFDLHFKKKVGSLRKDRLIVLQDSLVTLLNNFEKRPTKHNLKKLAKLGRVAYQEFRKSFEQNGGNSYLKSWDSRFTTLPPNESKDLFRIQKVGVKFPKGFTFPISLYFLKDIEKFDWQRDNITSIFDYFLGSRFRIYYQSDIEQPDPRMYLKDSRDETTNVIHVIDESLNTQMEEDAWKLDRTIDFNVDDPRVYKKKQLFEKWFDGKPPHLIHFSNHLKYHKDSLSYALTLSKNEVILGSEIAGKLTTEKKPLVFFNNCESGISHFDEGNFIEELYPNYSIGFVATLFKVKNSNASFFAKEFYRYFIERGYSIIESLHKAKDVVTSDEKRFFSSIGYILWEIHPELTFSKHEPIKKPVKKKLRKNGK